MSSTELEDVTFRLPPSVFHHNTIPRASKGEGVFGLRWGWFDSEDVGGLPHVFTVRSTCSEAVPRPDIAQVPGYDGARLCRLPV